MDGFLNLILVLQNTMAEMGHNGPLLPHSFMFPFLMCLLKIINLITNEIHNTTQNQINRICVIDIISKIDFIFDFSLKFQCKFVVKIQI